MCFFAFFFRADLSTDPPSRSLSPQHATGRKGLFRTLLVEQKPLSIKDDFKPKATAKENQPPPAALEDTSVRACVHLKNVSKIK